MLYSYALVLISHTDATFNDKSIDDPHNIPFRAEEEMGASLYVVFMI